MNTSTGLAALRARYPMPAQRPNLKPFVWTLDGGGRDLMKRVIAEHRVRLMIEVGVLYGGSCATWLAGEPDLVVIGIDPWDLAPSDVAYFWKVREIYGNHNREQYGMSDDEFVEQLSSDDGYLSTISNLWDYRDRFIPIRGKSPEQLYEIAELGIQPDLVYCDSDKDLKELDLALELFPGCLLAGDDWWWTPSDRPDYFPVQEKVTAFAAEHGLQLHNELATWVLER